MILSQKMYIHTRLCFNDPEPMLVITNMDMSSLPAYTLVETRLIEVEVPDIDLNQAKVATLRAERKELESQFEYDTRGIEEKIQTLLALPMFTEQAM